MKTRDLTQCALFAAVTAVMAQIAIPFPGGVPMTMHTLAVILSGIILGAKKGFIAQVIYVALGAIGVPVFAGFVGGAQVLVGPTGGFVLTFPIMAWIIGMVSDRTDNKVYILLGIILGALINYAGGTLQFMFVMDTTMGVALTACVIPFLVPDAVKIGIGLFLGKKLRNHRELRRVLNG